MIKLAPTATWLLLLATAPGQTTGSDNPTTPPKTSPETAVAADPGRPLTLALTDNGLGQWQLERHAGPGTGAPEQRKGRFEGPEIATYLRQGADVRILTADKAAAADQPNARQPAASHRVTIEWQPMSLVSVVPPQNPARPTLGPRPALLRDASVEVRLRIEDVAERTVLLNESFSIAADRGDHNEDQLAAFVIALADKAHAEVAMRIYFALRPPVVLRKWTDEEGQWRVEARISRRVVAGFRKFQVGNQGTLSSPDWQQLATASLVDGNKTSCTFALKGSFEANSIEIGRSEVRPIQHTP